MEPSLEGVAHKKSGHVMFNDKSDPPLKTDPLPRDSAKNSSIDVLPSKNVQVTTSSFRKAAAAEQVVLDFGDDYGFWENYQSLEKDDYGFWDNYLCLEKEAASANRQNQEQSKSLGEGAIVSGPPTIIEDVKDLSQDGWNLSSTKDIN